MMKSERERSTTNLVHGKAPISFIESEVVKPKPNETIRISTWCALFFNTHVNHNFKRRNQEPMAFSLIK